MDDNPESAFYNRNHVVRYGISNLKYDISKTRIKKRPPSPVENGGPKIGVACRKQYSAYDTDISLIGDLHIAADASIYCVMSSSLRKTLNQAQPTTRQRSIRSPA